MTDPFPPDADASDPAASRAEDALRAALAARASEVDFDVLDPAELALRARARDAGTASEVVQLRRRRGGWLTAVAALVVLVLAVPLGLLLTRTSSSTSTTSAAAGAAPMAAGGADTAAEKTGGLGDSGYQASSAATTGAGGQTGLSAAGGLPAPAPGYRYESFLDVVIQVPESWGYAEALVSDWCNFEHNYVKPSGPFMALPARRAVAANTCPGEIPEAMEVEHLEWGEASHLRPAGEKTVNGWVYSSRVVGGALITYVHRPGLNAGVLATAVQVSADHNGCPIVAPAGERPTAVTLPGLPTSGVLCRYADQPYPIGITGPPQPWAAGLLASSALDAAAASALLKQIESDEVVPGKIPDPNCGGLTPGAPPSLVARFSAGGVTKEVWLSGGCGVPTFDDGTLIRRAAPAACAGVFATVPPLARGTWSPAVQGVCKP